MVEQSQAETIGNIGILSLLIWAIVAWWHQARSEATIKYLKLLSLFIGLTIILFFIGNYYSIDFFSFIWFFTFQIAIFLLGKAISADTKAKELTGEYLLPFQVFFRRIAIVLTVAFFLIVDIAVLGLVLTR